MKKSYQLLCLLFTLFITSTRSFAQNNLAAGDLAIVSYQADFDPTNIFDVDVPEFEDRFSIVVLRPGGLAAGTVIFFTDRGWNAVSNNWHDEDYPPNTFGLGREAVIQWTVPAGGIARGTEVFFISTYHDEVPSPNEFYTWGAYSDYNGTTPLGTVVNATPIVPAANSTDGMSFTVSGDNLLVYQTGAVAGPTGGFNGTPIRFITALLANNNGTTTYANWDPTPGPNLNESSLPPGLVNGQTAFVMSPGPLPGPSNGTTEPDNGKFSNCAVAVNACTALQMSTLIYTVANWTFSNNVFPLGTSSALCTYTFTSPNTAGPPSSTPTLCVNTVLTNITHATTGATGIGAPTGLPPGVTASWASNTITISGTPTAQGVYNYSIPLTGGCGSVNATGTITVQPSNTVSGPSSTPTLCINTVLTNITHSTTNSSGIGAASGLPAGVTASYGGGTITISGTPTASGVFNYSIPVLANGGFCAVGPATGTITVNAVNTVNLTSGAGTNNQSVLVNTPITNITYATTGATGANVTGLPAGVTGSWAANVVTISGSPTTAVGSPFNYTVTLTGGCGTITATGTITVSACAIIDQTVTASPTSVCSGGSSTITVASSEPGINYTLRTNPGNTVISGPTPGTGAAINFPTGAIAATTTYNVLAETDKYSVYLNGGEAGFIVPENNALDVTNNFTIEAWIKPDNIGSPFARVFNKSQAYALGLSSGQSQITFTRHNSGDYSRPFAFVSGQWYHIACTYASGTVEFFVNGASVGTVTGVPGIVTQNLGAQIGSESSAFHFFRGNIDNVRIWNSVRTPAEISGNQMAYLSSAGNPTLAASWWISEGSGGVTRDFTVNAINTTSLAGTWQTDSPIPSCSIVMTNQPTVSIAPNNTITLTSAAATTSQTVCINSPIVNITYSTTGATGATVTGLPAGVSGSWAANVVTISGSPTTNVGSPFSYTVTLTGGCGTTTASGTITVSPNNTVTLTSAAGTNAQTVCVNTPITNITYATTGATGATVSGLPAGVSGSWVANVVTISGTPTTAVGSPFSYTVTLTGGCGTVTATGTITVTTGSTAAVISAIGGPVTLLDEEFATFPTATWPQQNLSQPLGASTWVIGGATFSPAPSGPAGSFIVCNFNSTTGTGTISNWLFTPVVNLANGNVLTFYTRCPANPASFPDRMEVRMSTNGASVNAGATSTSVGDFTTLLTSVNPTLTTTGYPGGWTQFTVTLSGLGAPTTGRFAFRYFVTNGGPTGSNSDIIGLDKVVYTQPGGGGICSGATANIKVDITGGASPYTVVYNANPPGGAGGNVTVTNYVSGTNIPVTPTVTTTYTLVSVTGANSCIGTGNSGTATVTVNPNNTVTLTSAAGTNAQNVCINTPISNITYSTTGATGATVTGLPAGVTGSWAANVVTISGTPTTTVGSPFTYTVTLTGGCGTVTATGTITVRPNNTITLTSAAGTNAQNVCINTPITNITYATTGATGATVSGLPAGVSGSWAANVVTISGTPTTTVGSPFSYTVTLTGGCGTVTATGTITVRPNNTVTLSSAAGTDAQTVCVNTPITNITYATTGATGATVTGLPTGVTGSWAANVVTISGTPTTTVGSPFTYTVTLTGGCGTVTATGTISVNPTPTVNAVANQVVCNNGTTAAVNFTGTPAGVMFNWTNNTTSIGLGASGTGNIGSFVATNATNAPVVATVTVTPVTSGSGFATFSSNGSFTVPGGVTSVRVLAVGGGGGGANGHQGGGGSGFVQSGTFAVIPGQVIPVTVGAGGTGAIQDPGNTINGLTPGLSSSFGGLLTANGGGVPAGINQPGGNGGSGGGGSCNAGSPGGNGGTLGSNGGGCTYIGGTGQGNYSAMLAIFTSNTFTAGAGGVGGTGSHAAGGGGGGVLMNGTGINGSHGEQPISGKGGIGYGGGGGGGGYNGSVRWAGGNGANGLVYVEWSSVTCTGTPITFTYTVNPTATVNAVANQTVCNGSPTTAVNFSSPTTGGTIVYNWTNNTPSIGLAASGTGNIAPFNGVNATNAPITATITVTPTYTNAGVSCVGTSTSFTITVNPTATVNTVANQVVCNGAPTTAVTFTSPTTGGTIVYNWVNNTPSIGLAANGTGNIASFNAINTGSAPVVATITVTPTYTNTVSCVGTPTSFTITVNPTATVNTVANQVVCNGAPTTAVTFTSPTTGGTIVYNWVNNTPSIGLAASGTGNIASFNAINTGSAPVVATITVTPTYTNGGVSCVGTASSFTITVNPTATVNTVPDQVLCHGANSTAVVFSSPTTGGTIVYNWTNNNTSIGLGASGTGNIPSFVAINIGTAPVVATITVTPTYTNGGVSCVGTPSSFTITVNPPPIINPVADQVVCNNSPTANINFSTPSGGGTVVYNWTNNNTSIGLAASGTGDILSFTATNATNAPVTATISVTMDYTSGGITCTSLPLRFTITVNPTPVVNQPADQVVCSNTPTAPVNFTSPVAGTVFNWTNNNTSIGLGASGTGNIPSFVAINNGGTPQVATITVTPTYTNPVTNNALTFNGSNRVNLSTATTIPAGNSPYTIEAWVRPTSISGADGIIGWGAWSNVNQVNAFRFNGPTQLINYWWGNDLVVNTPNVLDGNWHHVVATYNGTTRAIYFDGVLMGSDNPTGHNVTVTNNLTIAQTCPHCSDGEYLNGSLDEIRIWDIGKTQAQIQATMNTRVPSNSANLAAYYRMDEGTGAVTADQTGRGNNGVLTNGPTWMVPSTAPISDYITTTCTGSSKTFTITVNPTPVINPVPNQVVCNGALTAAVIFTGTVSPSPNLVYNWTNNTPSIGLAASGSGNIAPFAAVNTGNAPVTATITVTAVYTNGGVSCTSQPVTFTITVNPTPVVNPVANQVVCNGAPTTAVNFSSPTTGGTIVYNWVNNDPSIGLAASGTGNIASFTATNTTNAPVVATITVTAVYTSGGVSCSGNPLTFTITVNPTPTVNQPPSQVVCHGSPTAPVIFTGSVPGTIYSWVNSNITIGLPGAADGDIQSFIAINNTTVPQVATITVTPTYTNGGVSCTGTPRTFTITVNPIPTVTQVADQRVCAGATVAVSFAGPVAGTVFNWTNSNTAIGLGASGSGNLNFVATNTTTAAIAGTITVTPSYTNGGVTCTGPTMSFVINVNPVPTVNAVASQVVCNGSATAAVTFSGAIAGTVFNWTNNNTTIGLAASGTGNIASFTATNTTNAPVVATITVTPVFTTGGVSCTGASRTFTITVNPTPSVTAIANRVACNGATLAAITITGPVAGTTYNWTNSNTAIGLPAAGSNTIPAFMATNTTSAPITATITITPTYTNGGVSCSGPASSFTITVNPTPTVNTVANQLLCNGAATAAVNFTGAVAGTTYSWTNSNTSIGLAASGTGNIASFTATNTTNTVQSATITVTPSANTCAGASISFTITVNPTPTVNQPANQVVCDGSLTAPVNFSSPTTGGVVVYNWSNDRPNIGLNNNGSGNIPAFVAKNNTPFPIVATITVTPTFNNGGVICTGAPVSFTITVNPQPNIVFNMPPRACLTDTLITLKANPAGGTWSGPGVSGGTFSAAAAGFGVHTLSYTFTNTFGCTAISYFSITVNDCKERHNVFATAIRIYPNPSSGQFNIRFLSDIYTEFNVRVVTASGQELRTYHFDNLRYGSVIPMDLRNLPGGTYWLQVYNSKERAHFPFVIVR